MNTRMDKTLTDWIRLLVLLILLLMALFTIPTHTPQQKIPVSEEQPVLEHLVPVKQEIIRSHSQFSF